MRKRRRQDNVMVPTTSMGDIAFLLIIFFIICSTFTRDTSMELEMATSIDLDLLDKDHITVAMDKEGVIYCQGKIYGAAKTLESELDRLLEGEENPRKRIILFRCHYELEKKKYEPVIGAIAKAGGTIAALGEFTDEH